MSARPSAEVERMMRAATIPNARRVTVVFRFDDYCRATSSVGTELLALFQKYHIPCTYGVVPYAAASGEFAVDPAYCGPIDNETAGKLDDAVRSGLVEVAQHGFTHTANPALRVGGAPSELSEFRSLDYSSQLRMLSDGRRTLESLYHVSVTTFIPPWFTYDENTLRALDSLGFQVISSWGARDAVSGRVRNLKFLPYTCDLGDLREAVGTAREASDPDPLIVVLLHPYDFVAYDREKGKFTYQSFDDLLSWLAAQPDVATRTLGDSAKPARDLGPGRLESFRALRLSQVRGPSSLRTTRKWLFYPSTRLARRLINVRRVRLMLFRVRSRVRLILFYFSLYLLVTALTAVIAGLVARLAFSHIGQGPLPRIAEYAMAGLAGLYVIYIIAVASRRAVRHRHVAILVGLLGVCLGVWVAAGAHGIRTLLR